MKNNIVLIVVGVLSISNAVLLGHCVYKHNTGDIHIVKHSDTSIANKPEDVNAALETIKEQVLWNRCVELACNKECSNRGYISGESNLDNIITKFVICKCYIKDNITFSYLHLKVFIYVDKNSCEYSIPRGRVR
jgi:hypothetical protein